MCVFECVCVCVYGSLLDALRSGGVFPRLEPSLRPQYERRWTSRTGGTVSLSLSISVSPTSPRASRSAFTRLFSVGGCVSLSLSLENLLINILFVSSISFFYGALVSPIFGRAAQLREGASCSLSLCLSRASPFQLLFAVETMTDLLPGFLWVSDRVSQQETRQTKKN